jgi:hypothetical protein
MQTFMPYPDYRKSLESLDKSRLQKQSIESSQILDTILGLPTKKGTKRKGWLNHPAKIMWEKNPGALLQYFIVNIKICKDKNIKTEYCDSRLEIYEKFNLDSSLPVWFGNEEVHSSHRNRLLQKGWEQMLDAEMNETKIIAAHKTISWYKSFDWDEMQDKELMHREYKWPYDINENQYSLKVSVSKAALKKKQLLIQEYGNNPYIIL